VYVVTNDALARRQVRRGNLFLFAALAVFAAGVGLTSLRPDDQLASSATLGALLIGIFLWQLSLYYTRRWGPRERQDAALVKALKGLDNRYTLVVFSSPRLPDYLLLGPLGVRVLVARAVGGTIRYQRGRWSRVGTRGWQALLLGDPVRNPSEEARQSVDRVEQYLRQHGEPGAEAAPVGASIVFTDPRVRLELESGPFPTTTTRELRGHIQRLKGGLSTSEVATLRRLFEPPGQARAA